MKKFSILFLLLGSLFMMSSCEDEPSTIKEMTVSYQQSIKLNSEIVFTITDYDIKMQSGHIKSVGDVSEDNISSINEKPRISSYAAGFHSGYGYILCSENYSSYYRMVTRVNADNTITLLYQKY